MKVEVSGVRSRGHPRKNSKNKKYEDLREMNLRKTDAMDQDGWRAAIKSSNAVKEKDVEWRK